MVPMGPWCVEGEMDSRSSEFSVGFGACTLGLQHGPSGSLINKDRVFELAISLCEMNWRLEKERSQI